jgi:hypothetical protein
MKFLRLLLLVSFFPAIGKCDYYASQQWVSNYFNGFDTNSLLTTSKSQLLALANFDSYGVTNQFAGNYQAISRPFTVVLIGDSLLQNKSYDGIPNYLKKKGVYAGSDALSFSSTPTTNGVYAFGPIASNVLTNGGVCTITTDGAGGSTWCSAIEVYYWGEPSAGTLTVQAAANGGSYNTIATVNASNPVVTLTNLTATFNAGFYTFKLSASGTVKFLDVVAADRSMGMGVQQICFARGGYDWISFAATTNWATLAAALQPNLTIVQQLSAVSDWTNDYFLTNYYAGKTNQDFVLVTCNPDINSTNADQTVSVIKSLAAANGWTVFDENKMIYQLGGTNWENGWDGGYFTSGGAGIHPGSQLREFLVGQMFSALGLESSFYRWGQNNAKYIYGTGGDRGFTFQNRANGLSCVFRQEGNSVANGNTFGFQFYSADAVNGLDGGITYDSTGYHFGSVGGGAYVNYNPAGDNIFKSAYGFSTSYGTFSGNGSGLTNIPASSVVPTPVTNNQSSVTFSVINDLYGTIPSSTNLLTKTLAATTYDPKASGLWTNGFIVIGQTNLIGAIPPNAPNQIFLGFTTNSQGKLFVSSNGSWITK